MRLTSWGNLSLDDYQTFFYDFNPNLLAKIPKPVIAVGASRSYGDVGLNHLGSNLLTTNLNRFINLDGNLVTAQAGINFAELEKVLNLHKLSLPVRPGTSYLTLGGAVANDIHGKNHHLQGSFGCHIKSMRIWRSDSGVIEISTQREPDLFFATIGGIGLTGLIIDVTFEATEFLGNQIKVENLVFSNLSEFNQINQSSQNYETSVSWVNISGKKNGNGIYSRGNTVPEFAKKITKAPISYPKNLKLNFINSTSIKIFNNLYQNLQKSIKISLVPAGKYYFPLDGVNNWNQVYGAKGFYQYQSVVPEKNAYEVTEEMLNLMKEEKTYSFLTVLKSFGDKSSGGLLSFPMAGLTFAIDLQNQGEATLKLMNQFDQIIQRAGGRVYLAKDARMSREFFESSYPNYEKFNSLRDPYFSSDLSRRLLGF